MKSFYLNNFSFKLLLIILILVSITQGQAQEDSLKHRSVFIGINIGLVEYTSVNLGYQLSPNFSVALTAGGSFVSGGLLTTAQGLGIRLGYHTKKRILNCFTIKYIQYLSSSYFNQEELVNDQKTPFFIGNYFDITAGGERIYSDGFNFYWSLGLSYNDAKLRLPQFVPLFKIGLNYNFM